MLKVNRPIGEGNLFIRIFAFAVPLMLTSILQLVYNMADNIVVGRFSGDATALAAVGSTGSLNNLVLQLIFGLSAGTSVVVAQAFGAGDFAKVSRATHTAIISSLFCGAIMMTLGLCLARPALIAMGTKPDVLDGATLYFQIICFGMPAQALYNFGAAIIRAVGDTKTSLYILMSTGLVNVILNLVFVLAMDMSVDGVALATVISQYLSAIAVFAVIVKRRSECYAFSFKKLAFDFKLFARMLRYGVPASIQGSIFAISNVLITVASNSFETVVITARSIANNLDSIAYTSMNCFFHASMTFTAQSWGAKNAKAVRRSYFYSLIWVCIIGIGVSSLEFIFKDQLSLLFLDAAEPNKELILQYVTEIMIVQLLPYVLCGIMEVHQGALRGLGYSIGPMITALVGACLVRILWIAFIFPLEAFYSIGGLGLCYPVSWIITTAVLIVQLILAWRAKLPGLEAEAG